MKVVDVELTEDTQVFLNLEDGSNIAINLRRNYKNQVEMSVYTSNVDGSERLSPAIHMINSNTLGLEIRRK
ncbi:MAG: hypothetical protein ACRCX2_22020 [Paraclostridium sp.]